MTINLDNERIKRRHRQWLEAAKRFSDDTVQAYERAIESWETYTHYRDFRRINVKVAGGFFDSLTDQTNRRKQLSASTRYQTVRLVRSFYEWLASLPGRNSKAITLALGYLTVDRETVAAATSTGRRSVPTLTYVKQLASSIEIRTELDLRDRALISFLMLSGARVGAVASMPLGCFDRKSLIIYQDPKKGVKTKNRKCFETSLFKADTTLLGYVLDWENFLREKKLFGDQDPLFPRTHVCQVEGGLTFEAKVVEPVFWHGGSPIGDIIRKRAEDAGLEVYKCHSFRHAITRLAASRARSGEEIRAVSQNLGHENIGTTLTTYGKLDQFRVAEVISGLDLSESSENDLDPETQRLLEQLKKRLKRDT